MIVKASEPSLLKALEAREMRYRDRYDLNYKFSSASSTVRRLECQGTLKGHNGCVNTVSFSSDGQIVLTGSDDCRLILHDVGSLKKLSSVHSGHDHNVFGAQFVPEKGVDEAVTCAADGLVRHTILARGDTELNPSRNGTSRVLVEHDDMAFRIVLDPRFPTCLYSAGGDGVIHGVDLRIGGQAGVRRVASASFFCKNSMQDREAIKRPLALHAIDACPMTGDLYVGGTASRLYRLDPRYPSTYDIVYELNPLGDQLETACSESYPHGRMTSLLRQPHHLVAYESTMKRNLAVMTGCSVSYDGSEVLVTFNDDLVYLLDTSTADYSEKNGPQKQAYIGQRNDLTYKGVSFFGPRSEYVVSGSDCGHVFIWSKEGGELQTFLFADDTGPVNCLAPHPHLPILATSGYAYDAKIWAPTRAAPIDHEPEAMIGNRGLSAAHWMEVNSVGREHQIRVLPVSIVSTDSSDEYSVENEEWYERAH